jgi:hypothetical protein
MDRGFNGSLQMPRQSRQLYQSANGDRWLLVREPETAQVFVRHEANVPSGGQVTNIELGDFLSRGGVGPEKQELLRLIGSLVEADGNADEASG